MTSTITPTLATYTALQDAFDHFNTALFAGKLPQCLITLRSSVRAYGYMHAGRFVSVAGQHVDELGINPGYFAVQSMEEVIYELESNASSFHLPRALFTVKSWFRNLSPSIRNATAALLIGLFAALLISPIPDNAWTGYMGRALEPKVTDFWFSIRGARQPPKDVVIVSIDDESHAKFNVPIDKRWPRDIMARLLTTIAQHNPRSQNGMKKRMTDRFYKEIA